MLRTLHSSIGYVPRYAATLLPGISNNPIISLTTARTPRGYAGIDGFGVCVYV